MWITYISDFISIAWIPFCILIFCICFVLIERRLKLPWMTKAKKVSSKALEQTIKLILAGMVCASITVFGKFGLVTCKEKICETSSVGFFVAYLGNVIFLCYLAISIKRFIVFTIKTFK